MKNDNMQIESVSVGMLGTNCYLLRGGADGKEAVIVDPGDSGRQIAGLLLKQGVTPAAILLTHAHYDHILGVNEIVSAFPGLKVYIGEHEKDMVENPELNCGFVRGDCRICPDVWVRDGEILPFSFAGIRVIETPGHTRGSVCYYVPEVSALFAGDTLFYESYGRTDLPTGSEDSLFRSLKKLLSSLPDETRVYPGHGPATTIEHEKMIEEELL